MRCLQLLLICVLCLQSLVLSFNLKCKQVDFYYGQKMFFKTCNKTDTVFTSLGIKITSLESKIEPLTIEINYLPKGFGNSVRNVRGLSIAYAKLKSIKMADLRPFKNLKMLNLQGNQLEALDSDLFHYNSKLKYIDLSDNPLRYVGEKILSKLSLKRASFENCECINLIAMNGIEMKTLKFDLKRDCQRRFEKSYIKPSVKPFFIRGPSNQSVVEGSSVNFECRIGGYPIPDITWGRIAAGGNMPLDRVQILENRSLQLDKVTIEDEGKYSCEAENKVGSITRTVFLKVIEQQESSKQRESSKLSYTRY